MINPSSVRELKLPSGHISLIDEIDWARVSRYSWRKTSQSRSKTLYARTTVRIGVNQEVDVLLHRLITGVEAHLEIDHINNNGLDNRRANLRPATRSENHGNLTIQHNNSSGYKGVCWNKQAGKWQVSLGTRPAQYIGVFTDLWEAAQAYNAAALIRWGEYAQLNKRMH